MKQPASRTATREITGRHVAFGFVAFFGLIVAVNVTMATFASGTWPGLVVQNSYVESQRFNTRLAEARAQSALGYVLAAEQAEGRLALTLTDAAGRDVAVTTGTIRLGRPVTRTEDRMLDVPATANGRIVLVDGLSHGLWIADIALVLADGRVWRYETRFFVKDRAP